jgi:hypothetical protein
MVDLPSEKLTCRRQTKPQKTKNIMGDRSPKSNHKKSTQKQSKMDTANQKKRDAIAAKQTVTTKK